MIQRMFVTVDTKKTNYKNVGKINHGDDLILELTVLSDGDMISFNDPMVDLLVKKSDGKMIRQNSGIEQTEPNKFIIEVSKDCVTSPGLTTNQLIINDNGRISTCMFYYTILNSLEEDIIQSISNVEVLEQLDEFVIQIQDKMEIFDDELLNKISDFEDAIEDLEEFFGDTSAELLQAELSRNEAEQSRAQAESVRVQNENRRLQNDLDLANAEAERVRAENIRIQNEADRALVDAVMDQKESKREDSELERIQNESKRVTDEVVRQQNENTRQSNESIRMSNETDRKTQENRRVTAETNRVNAETTRRNNENSRISNETERQKTMNEMKSLIGNVNGVIDERVGIIEDEIDEINTSLDNLESEVNELKEGNIDIDLTNYVTEEEVDEKIGGVMNEMRTLIGDVIDFDERVGVIEDEIDEINSSLDNLESEVNELKKGNIEIDLTNYVTKNELSTKADKTELHSHTNKSVLDSITTSKVNQWDNIVNEFNDHITNHPSGGIDERIGVIEDEIKEINSSLDNIVTEEEVNETIGGVVEDLNDIIIEINNINSSLDNITNEFNEHITNHPSGGNDVVINSLEPSINDIPKVYFAGDINGMSKDNEKILTFSYKSNTKKINGFVKMKWQGNSSLNYDKKNFTIKMFKDEGCSTKDKHSFKEWNYETNKYVLKANYIDHSHARNIVSARLWNDVVKARTDYNSLPTEYQNMPNGGAIDGFPIKLYMNGVYQGLYTWNIGKEGWTYGMKSEKDTYAVLCGENYGSGCFRAIAKIDETDWSLEYPDTLQNSIKTSWNNAISFVMNNSGATFKNGLSTYFDVISLIDYYIFAYVSCGLDSMGKNQIYTTYDGTKWYAHMYDMDSTWGLFWNGLNFVSSSYRCQEDYQSMASGNKGNLLYIKLAENFGREIYERYSELRKSTLSIDNLIDRFERFTDIISNDLYDEDISVYNGIPLSTANNIKQIRNFIVARIPFVDSKIAELNTTPIPITGLTLNKTNTTVNVGSTDTLVVTYTPTNTTQRDIIWESSDTSKAIVTDGVVTGVSNGTCIITATSAYNSSLKATCSVTVQTVTIPVQSVSLDKTTVTLNVGATIKLTANVLPSNATNKNLTWKSSDETKATVVDGLVTAKEVGSVIITVTTIDGSKTANCNVDVEVYKPLNGYNEIATFSTNGINTSNNTWTSENGSKVFNLKGFTHDDATNGLIGGNLKFAGDQYLESTADISAYTNFTLAFNLINFNPNNINRVITTLWTNGTPNSVGVMWKNSGNTYADLTWVCSKGTVNKTTYDKIVVTKNDTTTRVYVNGVLIEEAKRVFTVDGYITLFAGNYKGTVQENVIGETNKIIMLNEFADLTLVNKLNELL